MLPPRTAGWPLIATDMGAWMSSTGWLTRTTSSVIMMVLLAVGSAAQDKPDFSGRWILEPPSQPIPDIPVALTVRQSIRRTTARGEPMTPYFNEIEIDRELPDGIHSETYEIGIIGGLVPGFEDGRTAGQALSQRQVGRRRAGVRKR